MPNTNVNQQGENFVERFEMSIMQFAVLNRAQQQGGVTKENLNQLVNNQLRFEYSHLDKCLDILVQSDHLKQEGNKYTITDDGREDVQKVQHLVFDLPNVLNLQRGQAQTTSVGGGRGTTPTTTGTTMGTQPNEGRNQPQGKGVGATQGMTQPGNISQQSGVQGQRTTADVNKGGATRPAGEKGNRP